MKTASLARWTGLVAGLGLAFVSLALARVPSGTSQVPAHVSLVAEPAVQLGVTPVGRELLSDRLLEPGSRSVSGLVQVSNLTASALAVRPRLRTTGEEPPAALRLEVMAGGRKLYDGALGELHAQLRLAPRAATRVRFRLYAPRSSEREVRGRQVRLRLRWVTRGKGR